MPKHDDFCFGQRNRVAEMEPTTMTAPATEKTASEARLPITGMTCASCVRRVEKALGKVAGVSEANVNLATEKATVAYDPALVTVDALTSAVEKAGYGVGKIDADAPQTPASTVSQQSEPPGEL